MRTKIIGTGSCLPDFAADNDWMSGIVETNDAWIQERTGIRERRIAGSETETTTNLAAEAGRRALEMAGIHAEELDLIIVATVSPDSFVPSTACQVQAALGAVNAVAFDMNAACSGFLFGLHTADAYIQTGFCKTALVIGSEVLSKMMDWSDRGTCILFGDGAGAAIVQGAETGILGHCVGSDGSRGGVLTCGARENSNPLTKKESGFHPDFIAMDGQEVFKFAVKTVPSCIEELLEKTDVKKEEISYYLLHQANRRIIQSVTKRLREPEEKFPINLDRYGNTSSASLGILLDEVNRKGMLRSGEKLVLAGFGAGLTWGALLIEW